MKQGTFITIVLVVAFVAAIGIFMILPKFITDGGFLVVALIALVIMVAAFIVERLFTLGKAKGTGSLVTFLKTIQGHINKGDIDAAIAACDKQRGSCANVLRTGLDRYKVVLASGEATSAKDLMDEVQHAIEESMMLEVPLLERNLVSLSTIASISTMIGLLGTVVGMIRSFAAMANAGAPDAIQLAPWYFRSAYQHRGRPYRRHRRHRCIQLFHHAR